MERNINENFIVEYIRSLSKEDDELLLEMRDYAEKESVPIIEPETAKLLTVLMKIKKPKKILEVGTAIGYSALTMMKALNGKCSIYTIEKNYKMINKANEYFEKSAYPTFHLLEGDAKDILHNINEEFDLIFMDAAKGQYQNFFNICSNLISEDGLIISDNVLFRGMVASDDLVSRRKITIVTRMREYLENISKLKGYTTSIIPIGDGVAITYKGESI